MVAVPSRRTLAVAYGAVAVAILTTVPLGWFGPLVDRVLAASTVTYRLDIWTNTLSLWQADPLSGVGPGSIGIGLTLTDLMNGYLFGNRHADNALIQLLGEAGLFGIVTASAAVAAVIAGYRPSRTGARIGLAGLIVLGTMSLTNNPTDSPNLVVLIIFYAALVAPHEVAVSHSLESALMRRIHTWALVGSGAAAILALASFTAAAFAYADGRSLAASGEWDLAAGRLEIAAALDPAMALYHRDLGIVLVESGNWAAADRELQVAINLNRADASALRALAVVQRTTDGDGRAMSSALKAAELRPLAAENWLAVAFVSADVDATAAATAAIRVAPWLSGSPFWADDFTGARLQSILEDAASASVASPVPRGEAARAWLTAVTNHDVHEQADAPEEVALDHVLRCETADAEAAYRDLDWSESTAGIVGRLMLARLTDAADTGDLSRIVALRHPDLGAAAQGHASAYSLFADPVADAQMYRRLGLGPATPGPVVPRTTDALGVWMMSPVETARRGAPEAALARCR
jgi:tetratricopeptide (TPR) repeat protein